ncbi:hypothetical protein [Mycobacterium nebraskense]|uniref:hypothetical protein n=1 Tax=Mycobacterium nebraskense TaxID=244292 RepID=UPI0012E11A56|nr:hypothetical protein [Mycobacterium nebraskense]
MTDLPPQVPQPDPRGWLAFAAPLPDELQRAEDSTAHADFYAQGVQWRYEWDEGTGYQCDYFERPATDTEKTLLTMLGYTVPDDLTTKVSFPSVLVRRRRWPQLETQEVQP